MAEKICKDRRFATSWTLKRHMDRVHGKVFFCPIDGCDETFETRHALAKHKKRHKKIFAFDRCTSTFVQEKYLPPHKSNFMKKLQSQEIFVLNVKSNLITGTNCKITLMRYILQNQNLNSLTLPTN